MSSSSCVKVLEILFLLDKQADQKQEYRLQGHLVECERCRKLEEECLKVWNGQGGMIIQDNSFTCPNDAALAKALGLQTSLKEERALDEHFRACRRCLKRFIGLYTMLTPPQKSTLLARYKSIAANIERSEMIPALQITPAKAILFLLLTSLGVGGIYLYQKWEQERAKQLAAQSEDQGETDDEKEVVEEKESPSEVAQNVEVSVLQGEFLKVAKGQEGVVYKKGKVSLHPTDVVEVPRGKSVQLALGKESKMTLRGPARLSMGQKATPQLEGDTGDMAGAKKKKKEIEVDFRTGEMELEAGKNTDFKTMVKQGKKKALQAKLKEGKALLRKRGKDFSVHSLKGAVDLREMTKEKKPQKASVKNGQWMKVHDGRWSKVQQIIGMPRWYYQMYPEVTNRFQIELTMLSGECHHVVGNKAFRWTKGSKKILPIHYLKVPVGITAKLALDGGRLYLAPKTEVAILKKKNQVHLIVERGGLFFRVYPGVKKSFLAFLQGGDQSYVLGVQEGLAFANQNSDRLWVGTLEKQNRLYYDNTFIDIPAGYGMASHGKKVNTPVLLTDLPPWYFGYFIQTRKLAGKVKKGLKSWKVQSGAARIDSRTKVVGDYYYLERPTAKGQSRVASQPFPLESGHLYRLSWKYRHQGQLPTEVHLIGRRNKKETYRHSFTLPPTPLWETHNFYFSLPPQLGSENQFQLVLASRGKGHLDFIPPVIEKLERQFTTVLRLPEDSIKTGYKWSQQSGFSLRGKTLVHLYSSKDSVFLLPPEASRYFHFQMKANLGEPFTLLFRYQNPKNGCFLEVSPRNNEARLIRRTKGKEQVLKRIFFSQLPPYQIEVIHWGPFLYISLGKAVLWQGELAPFSTGGRMGLLAPAQSRQEFQGFIVYHP